MKCNNCEHISAWLGGTCDNCHSPGNVVTYDDLIARQDTAIAELLETEDA